MVKKGRNVVLRGENKILAKLSDQQVSTIKKALSEHRISVMEVRDRFHISAPNLHKIISGSRWKHVHPSGSIEPVKGYNRPSALSKHLRKLIKERGIKETAKGMKLSVPKLRLLAYPLASGYTYAV